MKVLFISGADQQYGTFRMAMQLLEWIRKIDSSIKFIVLTQRYGSLNEWCNKHHFENHVVPYRYCVYYPMKNRAVDLEKHFMELVDVIYMTEFLF